MSRSLGLAGRLIGRVTMNTIGFVLSARLPALSTALGRTRLRYMTALKLGFFTTAIASFEVQVTVYLREGDMGTHLSESKLTRHLQPSIH